MDADVDAYLRVVVDARNIMRALRAIEVAQPMLAAICDSPTAWPFTHVYLSSLSSAERVGAALVHGPLPNVRRLTIATRTKHDIDEVVTILSAKQNASWVTKLEMITLEALDVGAYRATEIGNFLSAAASTPNLEHVVLRVNDHLERDIASSYLARRRDLTPREKKRVKGADKGERYISTRNESGKRTVRVQFLGERVGYVGGVLEHLRGVNRLEVEPNDPDQVTDSTLREAIWLMMNSPAPGIELPAAWTRPPLPPTPEFGSLPVEDLPTYFSLESSTRAEAWEKIRGWHLNEIPPSFDAPPAVNHLILTSSYAIFCTETNRRLARKFTFTRYMIQRVTPAAPSELPTGIAPEGYGLYTIHTPSGRTLLIAPEAIAQALGAGWV